MRQYGVQPAVVLLQPARLVVAVRLLTLHHEGARHLWATASESNPAVGRGTAAARAELNTGGEARGQEL